MGEMDSRQYNSYYHVVVVVDNYNDTHNNLCLGMQDNRTLYKHTEGFDQA